MPIVKRLIVKDFPRILLIGLTRYEQRYKS
jgi:hypothetical protein